MISYLGSLVLFSRAAGRAVSCRQTSLCVETTHHVPATLGLPSTGVSVLSWSTLLRPPAALYGAGPALTAVPVFGSSTKARIWLHLRVVSSRASVVQAARGLGALSPGAARLFPPQPQRALPVRSQEVFRQEPGSVCRVGGGGFSGAEFAPFPSPLPPTSSGDGPALLWSFSVPLFCELPAVCSGWSIFPSLSHSLEKVPLTALRAFGLVLTLSNAAGSSLFRPHLLVAGMGVWGTFLLGVAFRHVICGPYLIFPPS